MISMLTYRERGIIVLNMMKKDVRTGKKATLELLRYQDLLSVCRRQIWYAIVLKMDSERTKVTMTMTIRLTTNWRCGALMRGFLLAFIRILHSSPVWMTMPMASGVFRSTLFR